MKSKSFFNSTTGVLRKSILSLIGFQLLSVCAAQAQPLRQTSTIQNFTEKSIPAYFEIYKDFHQNPELSNEEIRTAKKVADHLRSLGMRVLEGVGGHGVVGILSNGQGPIGMLRADMDALPVEEATGLPYASQRRGVMHACGHDAHTALLMATAEAFVRNPSKWKGTLYFLFQPAEEVGTGAKAMLDDGLFQKIPLPQYGLAIHAHAGISTGNLFVRSGETLASSDNADIRFIGAGGHGASPHRAVDPIELGTSFVQELQRLVAREVDPLKEAVITVGSFHSGSKHNIIAETADLQITVRSFDDEVRVFLKNRILELANHLSKLRRAKDPVVNWVMGIPSVYNDPGLHDEVVGVFNKLPDTKTLTAPKTMASEDFAYYLKQAKIPTFFFWVGAQSANKPKPWPNAHSSTYAPDFPGFMRTGLPAMFEAVVHLQNKIKKPASAHPSLREY